MEHLLSAIGGFISAHITLWTLIGLFGQSMFMMRFVLQWIYSEKAGRSVVPEVFWYFSLVGGLIVLAYAIHKADVVFILGQATGLIIYLRNIHFIWREKKAKQQSKPS